ncbi:hypothetical protein [Piscinibacter sp. XHJ-5]|uniref:hypothetical protein n=1 Tax=Piscinibacter sp. XHJ-5 TaxID=3037797 RepID=UPI0024530206|nr:hypothetical protein [Piscinibacter sp. XHJ-5]
MDICTVHFTHATAAEVQALLRAFMEVPIAPPQQLDGEWVVPLKRLSADFVASELGVQDTQARALFAELVERGYLDGSGKPLTPAMALLGANGLPRISRAQMDVIIADLVAAAAALNARPGARIKIASIELFGSALHIRDDYGDVDVRVVFDEPDDLQPEDIDEKDTVSEQLQAVSNYVSMLPEFDLVGLDTERKAIYPAKAPLAR